MFFKKFHSQLFRRHISPNEKDFRSIVKAELLFRINDLEERNCTCMDCKFELNKYKRYYRKMIEKEKTNN